MRTFGWAAASAIRTRAPIRRPRVGDGDLAQWQGTDVDEDFRPFDGLPHQVDERGAAGDVTPAATTGVEGLAGVGRLRVREGVHSAHFPFAVCSTALTILT